YGKKLFPIFIRVLVERKIKGRGIALPFKKRQRRRRLARRATPEGFRHKAWRTGKVLHHLLRIHRP
ncbi:MAG TPA: hypothetical protein P5150_05375, partial [Candidatus Ratteibacteria bacterium]|nr:hypothetical protein [Candidatus Ratteibacteria bacterium]